MKVGRSSRYIDGALGSVHPKLSGPLGLDDLLNDCIAERFPRVPALSGPKIEGVSSVYYIRLI